MQTADETLDDLTHLDLSDEMIRQILGHRSVIVLRPVEDGHFVFDIDDGNTDRRRRNPRIGRSVLGRHDELVSLLFLVVQRFLRPYLAGFSVYDEGHVLRNVIGDDGVDAVVSVNGLDETHLTRVDTFDNGEIVRSVLEDGVFVVYVGDADVDCGC